MAKLVSTAKPQETCVLVGIITQIQTRRLLEEYLDELAFLAETANALTLERFTQSLPHPDSRTFVGTGKIEEIKNYVHEHDVDMVIFDDELAPSQLRNLEQIFNIEDKKVKILDRNNLILDIFARRARTAHAKVQVELAQYQYLLPRLTRMWSHLERQKGGIGMRGPGEQEIETDRRIVRDRISFLKKELSVIDRQKKTQRSNRGDLPRLALVGYTNVGKSTLMNTLSKSDVFAENKLFATLDTTVRKIVLENKPFLLTDTVGFIRKLPHDLIESFKSTLDEVREADILIHVVDVAHPQFEDHIKVVNDTLKDIHCGDKKTLLLFNKMDAFHPEHDEASLEEPLTKEETLLYLKKTWMAKMQSDVLFISAQNKINLDELRDWIVHHIWSNRVIPFFHFNIIDKSLDLLLIFQFADQ